LIGTLIKSLDDEPPWSCDRGRLRTKRRQVELDDFSITALYESLTKRNDCFLRSVQTLQRATATKPSLGVVGLEGKRPQADGAQDL
jgi:hypothetical protein